LKPGLGKPKGPTARTWPANSVDDFGQKLAVLGMEMAVVARQASPGKVGGRKAIGSKASHGFGLVRIFWGFNDCERI
jgi:hypothetical protein